MKFVYNKPEGAKLFKETMVIAYTRIEFPIEMDRKELIFLK